MKKLILFFGLIGMLSLASCDSASVKPVSLTGYVLEENPEIPFMRFPYRLEIKKHLLFAFDMASDSMFYHVLSYPGLDYLYSFGKKGNGPEEIILPTPFQFYKDELLVLDGARAKLYCYENVSQDSLRNPSFMDLGASRAVDFVKANDSVLLVEDLSGEGRLIKYSPSGNEKLYSIPQSDEHSEANALKAYLWRSFMSYNTELNKLAMATQSGDVLEIYDFESGKSQVVVGDGGMPREEDQIEGFHDIHWIGDEIYALYSGRSRDELSQKYANGHREPDGGNWLNVYDSDGTLLKVYQLDCFINGFAYDREKDRIVGITSNSDNPFVFFDLKVGL